MEVNAAEFLQLGFANLFDFLNGILISLPLPLLLLCLPRRSITEMNRSGATDSDMSLDAGSARRQNRGMTDGSDTLYLERRDPARNMARYYMLSIEHDLFDSVLAVRRWGRIGLWSRQVALPCADRETARTILSGVAAAKRRRGYAEPVRAR